MIARNPQTVPLPSEWATLWQHYSPTNQNDIIAFLEKHGFLMPVLEDLALQQATYFHGARLRLELRGDPESDSEADNHLAVFIPRRDVTLENANTGLEKFDDAWGYDNMWRANGLVFTSIDWQ